MEINGNLAKKPNFGRTNHTPYVTTQSNQHSTHIWERSINPLATDLFCCKFNLVDTDQFSCEYLVWVLCYCSQTDVLFPHWVGALAHTRDAENAPPIAGVKPEMCCDLDIFLLNFDALGWLLTDPNT